jgi:hypothetical protein
MPWGFDSPSDQSQAASFPELFKDAGDRHMKAKILPMIVLVALSLMLISTVTFTQAGDEKSAPTLGGLPPRMEPQMPVSQCYYCVEKDNPGLWKWHIQNRLSDFGAITRSDLNPESDLDYMMRTY